jgi:hypothetical protein
MKSNKLEQQVQRFFRSGFKRHWFTNDLYRAFYIHSNLFIAHFDKDGFYKARFQDPNGFFKTIDLLRKLPAARWETESDMVRSILGAYARDYLARMEICEQFLNEQETA